VSRDALEDGRLTGDRWLVATISFAVHTSYPVRLPPVIEGPASLSDDQLGAATLYSACEDGSAELTVEPAPWWLPSGRVAAKGWRVAGGR
jgi:hypothetical protein